MTTMILTFLFFLLIISAMSVGVMFGRKPIQGTCGGLNTSGSCEICGGIPEKCPEQQSGTSSNTKDSTVRDGSEKYYNADATSRTGSDRK